MTLVLAVLLLGALGSKIPTDADIAARIKAAIVEKMHPADVQVVVSRKSALSTTVENLEITITGFTADSLPLGSAIPPTADNLPPDQVLRQYGRLVRIKNARVVCKDFVLKSLPVQEMELNCRELRIPWEDAKAGHFTIVAAGSVGGYLLLPQQGLTQFLRGRKLAIEEPAVTITPDGCRVNGAYRLLVAVPVEVSGRLVVKDQAKLCLDAPKLKISVVTLPEIVANRLLKDVNPLTDLNADFHLPAPLTITSVTHTDGCLRLEATLQFLAPE